MSNRKLFDPDDVDEGLTRVVEHNGKIYLLFPFIEATGTEPRFTSTAMLIKGPTATVQDFKHLTALIRQAGHAGAWFITFSTPWLLNKHQGQAELNERARKIGR